MLYNRVTVCTFTQVGALRRRSVAFEKRFVGVRTHWEMSAFAHTDFDVDSVVWGYD